MTSLCANNQSTVSFQRKLVYEFLIVGFKEPLSIETLQRWKDMLHTSDLSVLAEGNIHLNTFFTELKEENVNEVVEKEKNEFFRIFNVFNDKGEIPAPPWESVYVTKDQTMFGETVFQLRDKLHQFGLRFINENEEPEDHIAIQLEFMLYLLQYTEKAFEERQKDDFTKGIYNQYWLLTNHLMQWVKPFTKDIHSSSTSVFYKGIATLLLDFIDEEFEYIKSFKEVLENG
ncbi:molecular chaperone [Cytobacillus solani]|uniref:Dehydrogenase n=1 Tax=Cytobacillus solani TaxID=1637975 RepID=A0A0Q3VG00_9BACI|nr:molecular chaperone TorD family protein [Cytobacillus solani]KOP81300.1 hypothetical protein AMS60_01570 [Bacillus sp. FJAT-21945]KQL18314.1 hypothetical protein AN957_06760 [Cytobacillus solani]USK56162.1 molecular chaperone TorD family protein [Cytobacillus solani]